MGYDQVLIVPQISVSKIFVQEYIFGKFAGLRSMFLVKLWL